MSRIIVLTSTLILLTLLCNAQGNVLDGAYARENQVLRPTIPLQAIRESDAMYSKKVLRCLDLNEKRNHPLYFPIDDIDYPAAEGLQPKRSRLSLASLVFRAAYPTDEYGNLKNVGRLVYKPASEQDFEGLTQWWRTPVSDSSDLVGVFNIMKKTVVTLDLGLPTEHDTVIYVPSRIAPKDVKSIYMWEEWVFDKQRSVMDVRIIALLFSVSYEGYENEVLRFWINFEDYKDLFATHEVFNQSGNDGARLSYFDLFQKRLFSSFIVAESNVYDNRMIKDYLMGIEAIREGERIQGVLADYEHDQWEY
ncbi:MAG: gliding motility protein GldN [Bacteroidales bacterium]|nr:gliding motility protein GldN [Bacteroidales bacterium]